MGKTTNHWGVGQPVEAGDILAGKRVIRRHITRLMQGDIGDLSSYEDGYAVEDQSVFIRHIVMICLLNGCFNRWKEKK